MADITNYIFTLNTDFTTKTSTQFIAFAQFLIVQLLRLLMFPCSESPPGIYTYILLLACKFSFEYIDRGPGRGSSIFFRKRDWYMSERARRAKQNLQVAF